MWGLKTLFRRTNDDQFYYRPSTNGRPDAGEVCWAWVPYEDDPSQGKDRPVLIVGRRGRTWLAVMLTSKDHDHDAVRTVDGDVTIDRYDRRWLDVGTGSWDRSRRPSEARLDRLLVLSEVRREGSALPRPIFDRVVAYGRPFWSA